MDVQGHLLEYDLNPVFHGEDFYANFPQRHCGEDDPRVCFSIEHFLEAFFIRSDTNVVVLSALPIYPEGSPLSPQIMAETRRIVEGLCRDERVLLHGQVLPNVGTLESVLDGMEQTASRYPIRAWKTFTHFPDFFDPGGGAWWLDDHERGLPPVGEPFIRRSVDLGIRTICVHKGLSGGSRYASPMDVGPAARTHPDVNFVVYHSGYESGGFEGPFTAATAEVGREPPDRVARARRHRAERERVRGARLDLVERDADADAGGARPRQAAEARGPGQRRVGDRLPVLRIAPAADPGLPGVPDLGGVPGALPDIRGSRRSSRRRSSDRTPRGCTRSRRCRRGATSPGASSRRSARSSAAGTCSSDPPRWRRRPTSASTTGWRSRPRRPRAPPDSRGPTDHADRDLPRATWGVRSDTDRRRGHRPCPRSAAAG